MPLVCSQLAKRLAKRDTVGFSSLLAKRDTVGFSSLLDSLRPPRWQNVTLLDDRWSADSIVVPLAAMFQP